LALATVATLLAVGGVMAGLWRVVHGDFVGIVALPLGLLFWYWIGVGAWRRAVHHA
jgi:ABC-type transport system involved in Fe-S cluster assembly fused permease/ATPase subunit